jgi:copper(I)-binding protein
VTGAFMVIHNHGSSDRKLLKAASPAAQSVELHNHLNDNGVMKMREVAGIEIKAKAQAELKPGSYHVMLIGMKQALKEGDVVPITLSFDDGSTQQVDAPVLRQAPAGAAPMPHGAMQH